MYQAKGKFPVSLYTAVVISELNEANAKGIVNASPPNNSNSYPAYIGIIIPCRTKSA